MDAFQPLEDAYIYRGSLNKRAGYIPFGSMAYRDAGVTIDIGDGGTSYGGTLASFPIRAGTFTGTDGTESFTDDGLGVLTGSAGGMGTIVYATGVWTFTFNASVAAPTPIYGAYTYEPANLTTPVLRPIMGLKTWINSLTGTIRLLCFDTDRVSVYNDNTGQFDPINTAQNVYAVPANPTGAGVLTTFITNLGFTNIPFGTVSITDGTDTVTDPTGSGTFGTTATFTPASTLVYATGAVVINYTNPPGDPAKTITVSYTLSGDYFTGSYTNFFNTINWVNPFDSINGVSTLYATNNVDRITCYDGTSLFRPNFPVTQAQSDANTNGITTTLNLKVYKNRLLLLRPTIVGSTIPEGHFIRFSAVLNPTNLIADVVGNGGSEPAPTEDFIFASEFLRDQLIVFFKNSTWSFTFTGITSVPFRWTKLNNSKSTNSPYASVEYDDKVTSVGSKGLIACDGVSVQRYDLGIIDLFLNDIDIEHYNQCYSQRFDNINQTWILYPTTSQGDGQLEGRSNRALVYNFLENTWAVYNLYLSCLGLYRVVTDKTWADFPTTPWEDTEWPWDSYLLQGAAPNLLGGSHDGQVYQMNTGETDNGTSYVSTMTSTVWNPYFKEGAMASFAYFDFYYLCNTDVTLTINFYLNGSEIPVGNRTINFAQASVLNPFQKYNFQRVYFNVSAQSIQMQITSLPETDGNFVIYGITMWAKKEGRLVPAYSFI